MEIVAGKIDKVLYSERRGKEGTWRLDRSYSTQMRNGWKDKV
jgi:hypothetical protein